MTFRQHRGNLDLVPATPEELTTTSIGEPVSVVVFSPANMNAIDGSSVWVQTITLALAGVDGVKVSLLLSHRVTTDRLVGPLIRHPNIEVIDPVATGMTDNDPLTLDEAAQILASMTVRSPQAFVVRGAEAAHRLAQQRELNGKLWPYLTDIPQRAADIGKDARKRMSTIMSASPVILCQTEELLEFLESEFRSVKGKGWLYPPAIPGDITPVILPAPTQENLRICYAGKFARKWNTYEMCDLPTQLAARGISAQITMVGDKINRDPEWPEFVAEMRRKLEASPGVDWVGGVSRERSIEYMSQAHLGLSWRSPKLDDSLELSTKLLEYCAAGTPPVLNRTPMHERIFGNRYPLFVDSESSVLDVLASVASPRIYETALETASRITNDYTLDRASQRLSELITKTLEGGPSWTVWRFGLGRRGDPVDRPSHR